MAVSICPVVTCKRLVRRMSPSSSSSTCWVRDGSALSLPCGSEERYFVRRSWCRARRRHGASTQRIINGDDDDDANTKTTERNGTERAILVAAWYLLCYLWLPCFFCCANYLGCMIVPSQSDRGQVLIQKCSRRSSFFFDEAHGGRHSPCGKKEARQRPNQTREKPGPRPQGPRPGAKCY